MFRETYLVLLYAEAPQGEVAHHQDGDHHLQDSIGTGEGHHPEEAHLEDDPDHQLLVEGTAGQAPVHHDSYINCFSRSLIRLSS